MLKVRMVVFSWQWEGIVGKHVGGLQAFFLDMGVATWYAHFENSSSHVLVTCVLCVCMCMHACTHTYMITHICKSLR